MDNRSILEYISQISEINDTSEYMQDPVLDEALDLIVKFVMKSDSIPTSKIADMIVKIESMAAMFSVKKVYYATIEKGKAGSEQANKKNIYYAVAENLPRISDALKYKMRASNV